MIAAARVDNVGEKRDLEWNSILSAIVGASITELREWCCSASIVHSLFLCLVPCMIILPLWKMYSLCLSKSAVQPASHNCPMESRDPEASWRKMCVFLADSGRFGMSRRAVCVDFMVALLGRRTSIPRDVGLMFVRGMVV